MEDFSEYLNKIKLNEAKVTKLPYEGKWYIQQEGDKFLVYVASGGSKLPEFYKEFKDKKSALKEFNTILATITKISDGYKKV
jgi:hypothetical protein